MPRLNARSTWILLALVGFIALAGGWYFGGRARLDADPAGGKTLLGVSLPDTRGQEQALAQWKGKVLVVNFWATWCVPCREEMPEFLKL